MPSNTLSPLPLMELSTGFWSFKTLASAYELGLFEQLSGTSGTTARELADGLGIASCPAEMLLTACAALGLLHSQNGRYVNSPLSDESEGRNYTAVEYSDWLTEAGFVDPQVVLLEAPGANGVVTARKP